MHPECGWPEQLRRLRRRVAGAALLLLVPSIPLILFALVGLPHVFRSPLVRNVLARVPGAGPPAADAPRFAETVALVTGTALAGGHLHGACRAGV